MEKSPNHNHEPKKAKTKVEPIKSLEAMEAIKNLLADRPRDFALFTVGINTNLKVSELLLLKAGTVRKLKPMDKIKIKGRGTSGGAEVLLNRVCIDAIQRLLASRAYQDDDPLFKGRGNRPLTLPSVTRLVKNWCKAADLKGNYGGHTLRKTFGYHQRVTFNVGVEDLMVCFNHATQKQTLDYLCIEPGEGTSIFANEL
jgi:integrase